MVLQVPEQIIKTTGDVAKTAITEVGDVIEGVGTALLQPRSKAPAIFIPDTLEVPRPGGGLTRRDIMKILRDQRRHEYRLIKLQARTNERVAVYNNPLFWVTIGTFSALGLFMYVVKKASEGEAWAQNVLSYIPNPNEMMGALLSRSDSAMSWITGGVEWAAEGVTSTFGKIGDWLTPDKVSKKSPNPKSTPGGVTNVGGVPVGPL